MRYHKLNNLTKQPEAPLPIYVTRSFSELLACGLTFKPLSFKDKQGSYLGL